MELLKMIREWKRKRAEQDRKDKYNHAIVDHAWKNGMITQTEFAKYKNLSLAGRTGFAYGIVSRLSDDLNKQFTRYRAILEVGGS